MRAAAGSGVCALLAAALSCGPAEAAERTLSVTDFDRVQVSGGYLVEVVTGRGPSARVSGSPQALERVEVQNQGRTLIVRPRESWGGWPGAETGPVTVRLTTPFVRAVGVLGSAVVTVDRMRAARVEASISGSGSLTVGAIESDAATATLSGSGDLTLAGRAANLVANVRGSGDLDAARLLASDVRVTSKGAGNVSLAARRSAAVFASGSGNVAVEGGPACTVSNTGSGAVVCGNR